VQILAVISQELGTLSNVVALEGHTPTPIRKAMATWELFTDRANSARRARERFGLRPGQINAVRGYADTRLRIPTTSMPR
jgi:chemotaxis protein MotB